MGDINIDQLAQEIARTLTNHGLKIQKGIGVSAARVAKKVVKTLKQTSPEKSGDYRNGWTSNNDNEFSTSPNCIVFNKTDYQLTHLLENGHAKTGGGRTEGQLHIRPAEEMAIAEFIKEVEEVISNADGESI